MSKTDKCVGAGLQVFERMHPLASPASDHDVVDGLWTAWGWGEPLPREHIVYYLWDGQVRHVA